MTLRIKRLRTIQRRVEHINKVLIPRATAANNGSVAYHREEAAALLWALSELDPAGPPAAPPDQVWADARTHAIAAATVTPEPKSPDELKGMLTAAYMAGFRRRHGGTTGHAHVDQALDLIVKYGGTDGEHHTRWVLDQVVRLLAGPRYAEIVRHACAGEDGPRSFRWNVGIAP